MADNQEQGGPVEQPAEAQAAGATVSAKEIEEGKAFAILGYIVPLLCLIPLINRNNNYSLYHAKQVLLLWIGFVVSSAANVIPCAGQIVWIVAWVFLVVLDIIGLVNAVKCQMKPLPLIGKFGEDWFKGIQKV
ncbi:MAG: hypothetical protein FJ225_06035 [Lentisphaerae bacterium]|nr:hypothetical protein [Lentisphaerota bacterium]